jgi:hypothetical protein
MKKRERSIAGFGLPAVLRRNERNGNKVPEARNLISSHSWRGQFFFMGW